MRCCSEKPDQGKSTRRSSPDFCLRSLSEIPGRKVFYEGLLHLRSHHRECGRTMKWFTGTSGVEKRSKECIPTPRPIALIELASPTCDAKQAGCPAISGL